MTTIEQRVGELARESLDEWSARFRREQGMPEPTHEEMRAILKARAEDDRSYGIKPRPSH